MDSNDKTAADQQHTDFNKAKYGFVVLAGLFLLALAMILYNDDWLAAHVRLRPPREEDEEEMHLD